MKGIVFALIALLASFFVAEQVNVVLGVLMGFWTGICLYHGFKNAL